MFAERLNDTTEFDVKEAETGDCIETGKSINSTWRKAHDSCKRRKYV